MTGASDVHSVQRRAAASYLSQANLPGEGSTWPIEYEAIGTASDPAQAARALVQGQVEGAGLLKCSRTCSRGSGGAVAPRDTIGHHHSRVSTRLPSSQLHWNPGGDHDHVVSTRDHGETPGLSLVHTSTIRSQPNLKYSPQIRPMITTPATPRMSHDRREECLLSATTDSESKPRSFLVPGASGTRYAALDQG